MALNSNQFLQSIEVGFCDRNTCCFNPIPVVVASTQSTPIGVGVAVSLATNTVHSVPKIVASTGTGSTAEDVFGFTFIHTHKNAFAANDFTDVLPVGSGAIIYLKAEGAISAGALVSFTISGGTIDTAAGGEVAIGQALIGAASAGDLIPVYLNQPFGTVVPTPST